MRKVLLATDGSSYAENATWLLSHLPHAEHLEVIVLTVLQAPDVHFAYPTTNWISECLERERGEAVAAFATVKEMFEGANVTLRHSIREGHRAATIVDVAEEQDVDVIVMGARGHSAVDRILLGSTSDYVATQAPCSVLVVRPTEARQEKRPLKVAIAYEESGPARAALEEFSEIGWGPQTHVDVVSVISPVPSYLGETITDIEPTSKRAHEAAEEAVDLLHNAAPRAKATVLQSPHVGEGLVHFLETQHCDLVVIGETPRNLLGRVLLGSVSLFVLRHAPCSVWVTRNRPIHSVEKQRTQVTRRESALPTDS